MTVWTKTCCIGHSIDLLQLLAKDLNFNPHVHAVEDGFYGINVNGTWNGVVGELLRNKAEFAAAPLTVSKIRSGVVDFVAPSIQVSQGMLMLANQKMGEQETILPALHFLEFTTKEFLWAFLGFFIIGLFVVFVKEYISMRYQGRLEKEASNTKPLWMETFTYVSGITFQRDLGGRNPKGAGARLTAIVVAFGMVVVMTAYTAVLAATKVMQEVRDPFKGLHDERVRFKSKSLVLLDFLLDMRDTPVQIS